MPSPKVQHQAMGIKSISSNEDSDRDMIPEGQFRRMLALEQKRSERSRRRFVLMLLEFQALLNDGSEREVVRKAFHALAGSTRETDIKGWYKEDSIIGVIFTEVGPAEGHSVANALLMKVTEALSNTLGIEQINRISLSFHVYPAAADGGTGRGRIDHDILSDKESRSLSKGIKRAIDLGGSAFVILFSAPLMTAIAIAVKVTSPGPVLFRQKRIGRYGTPFTFLKFRSMYHGNDATVHQQFVTRFIKGEAESGTTQFKLTADARITPLGKILRKTSLDELPQLFNVLMGHMSLVGPRPPVPYEFDSYDVWHRRRLVDAKPGITGLWQVAGRSRVGFDDMVRMDLRYARAWSLWLDLKILLLTPRAVVSGNGAY